MDIKEVIILLAAVFVLAGVTAGVFKCCSYYCRHRGAVRLEGACGGEQGCVPGTEHMNIIQRHAQDSLRELGIPVIDSSTFLTTPDDAETVASTQVV